MGSAAGYANSNSGVTDLYDQDRELYSISREKRRALCNASYVNVHLNALSVTASLIPPPPQKKTVPLE